MDSFTKRRLIKFVTDFRAKSGTPPALKDFEAANIPRELVEEAVKAGLLEMFYVNLTTGSVVKTYRLRD